MVNGISSRIAVLHPDRLGFDYSLCWLIRIERVCELVFELANYR